MAEIGVNVGPDGIVDPNDLAEAGVRWIRIVATEEKDLRDYIKACQDKQVRVLLAIARESLPTLNEEQTNLGEAARHAAHLYRERYGNHFDALQVCNEPDGNPPSSWVLSSDQVNEVLRPFREIFNDAHIVGPGMCSGDPNRLNGVDLSLVDAISVHPYGQGVPAADGQPAFSSPFGFGGDVAQLLNRYATQFNKPVWISEWGINDNDLAQAGVSRSGEERAAEYVGRMIGFLHAGGIVQVALYFCWGDNMVPQFGLFRADGSRKPAYEAFKTAAQQGLRSGAPPRARTTAQEEPAASPRRRARRAR